MADIPIRSFAVSVVVIRENPVGYQVLLLRRNHTLVGEWCQIAGGIEDGETAWQTALREVREETGLVCQHLYSGDICEHSTRQIAMQSVCSRFSWELSMPSLMLRSMKSTVNFVGCLSARR